jgi:hypothetical protein
VTTIHSKTRFIATTVGLLLCSTSFAQAPIPKSGFIPDEKTAIRIAEAVLSPIYGEQKIIDERPFHAILSNGLWIVEGSLRAVSVGGVATIRLDKKTGAVISYIHGK